MGRRKSDSVSTNDAERHPTVSIHVVFDTNILHTHSASDLVKPQVVETIKTPRGDLNVSWYIPSVVRQERQYQMLNKALDLFPTVEKLERLLRHPLNITKDLIKFQVNEVIERQLKDLSLIELPLQTNLVNWENLISDAVNRRPPFQVGEKEKGFRDALIVESFLQLLASKPSTPKTCRVVLMTEDALLKTAAENRLASTCKNAVVLPNLEELANLMNVLGSEVTENFINTYRDMAKDYFFREGDDTCLYVREKVREMIIARYASVINKAPAGATSRRNKTWYISPPTFVAKKGQRVTWSSRIKITAEALKAVPNESKIDSDYVKLLAPSEIMAGLTALSSSGADSDILTDRSAPKYLNSYRFYGGGPVAAGNVADASSALSSAESYLRSAPSRGIFGDFQPPKYEVIGQGFDALAITWSVTISTGRKFVNPKVEDVSLLETSWELP